MKIRAVHSASQRAIAVWVRPPVSSGNAFGTRPTVVTGESVSRVGSSVSLRQPARSHCPSIGMKPTAMRGSKRASSVSPDMNEPKAAASTWKFRTGRTSASR